LNETLQLLVCADDLNMSRDNMNTTKESSDANKEVGLKVNTEEAKHMLVSRHQNAGQINDINTDNRYCECMTQFKISAVTVKNGNLIHE
jgi:hypothetical protein